MLFADGLCGNNIISIGYVGKLRHAAPPRWRSFVVELGLACLSLPYLFLGWDRLQRSCQLQNPNVPTSPRQGMYSSRS